MEVFITKANAERIVHQMDLSEIDILEFKRSMRFKWFNNGELKKLKAFMTFFSNPDLFAAQYVKLNPRGNENKFVYKGGSPAYHESCTCDRLNADFKNIIVPKEIDRKGIRNEYLQWCEDKRELFEKHPDRFKFRLNTRFNLTIDPFIRYDNSGFETFENYTLEELELAIEKKIMYARRFYNESEENWEVLSFFALQSFNYKNPEKLNLEKLINPIPIERVIKILETLELEIKQPLFRMLKNYYRVKNNKNLKFDADILSNLGFNPCTACSSASVHEFFAA